TAPPAARPATPFFDAPRETSVRIESSEPEFIDSTRVTLSSPNPGATLRYTVDGTPPDERSPLYTGALTLTGTTTVRARAFHPDLDDRFAAALTVEKLRWREGIRLEGVGSRGSARGAAVAAAQGSAGPRIRDGLECRYYEGNWSKLPDFDSLRPRRTGTAAAVAYPADARGEEFGCSFRGYLAIPADGAYTLHLASDDGSALWLDDEKVIDNDGLHGDTGVPRRLALRSGYHPLRVDAFQCRGDAALRLEIEGPGLARQPVPPAMLGH
ncbi:MAG: PA14 domain-containing protein, partial [Candidatus Eisenbacteria bacterium]|nr:PA14 domain-containing protein [Candidatus Eisenbacteria bacterium]